MRISGTFRPISSYDASSSPSRSYSRPSSQRSSCTTSSIRFEVRVDATPNRSRMLIRPRPRTSMWWRVSSGHAPITIDSDRRRTSTVSSATRRWPRTTRSSAHSLLPMPLSPTISTPRPRMSISTPWMISRCARRSSSTAVSLPIAAAVGTGVRRIGTLARSPSATTSRRNLGAAGDEQARQVGGEALGQRVAARARRRGSRGSAPRSRRRAGCGRPAGTRGSRRARGRSSGCRDW